MVISTEKSAIWQMQELPSTAKFADIIESADWLLFLPVYQTEEGWCSGMELAVQNSQKRVCGWALATTVTPFLSSSLRLQMLSLNSGAWEYKHISFH